MHTRWAHSRSKHVEIDKYSKHKLCTKLALFARLYRDARSTKCKIKIDLKEGGMGFLFLAEGTSKWWAVVNSVMNLRAA